MGFDSAFAYAEPAEIFAEHAALSAFENDGARDFDIGALAALDDARYEDLDPVPVAARCGPACAAAHVCRRSLLHARTARRASST